MNAPDEFLKKLDTVYHCALHCITGCSYHAHCHTDAGPESQN